MHFSQSLKLSDNDKWMKCYTHQKALQDACAGPKPIAKTAVGTQAATTKIKTTAQMHLFIVRLWKA